MNHDWYGAHNQNGKLVGAVTHVLISKREIEYWIFIEEMLDAAFSMRGAANDARFFLQFTYIVI